MIEHFQVVARRHTTGGSGYWHHRPYPVTTDVALARQQEAELRQLADAVEVVTLLGANEPDVYAQYNLYINFRPCRVADLSEDKQREVMEFAPLRDSYTYPRYQPPFHAYAWGAALGPLIRLMDRVQKGLLGGANDGATDGANDGETDGGTDGE